MARSCRTPAGALLVAVVALAALGCSDATHAVGQVRAESQRIPQPGSAGDSGRGGLAGAAGTGSTAGESGGTSQDAALPPATFDPVDVVGCGALTLPADRKALDLYLMVDNNLTLMLPQPDATPWDALLRGIEQYVDEEDAAGTGVGVDFFGFECTAGTYATPSVRVRPLPDNADAIKRALATVVPINVSPMRPALEGAIMHSKSRANAYPDTKQAVVLISDGYADLFCGSSTINVSAVAAEGFGGTPSIPTYVVALDVPSLDNILNPLTRLDSLDAIARQGGTGRARRIDIQDSTEVFVDTMLDVQLEAETCEYAVPDMVRDDPDQLSLGVLDAAGLARALEPQPDEGACGEGFYFDADMAWAVLCPRTCNDVKQSREALLWFTDC